MKRLIGKLLVDIRGGTAIEYGLILSLVVVALIAALINFANTSVGIWTDISAKVSNAS